MFQHLWRLGIAVALLFPTFSTAQDDAFSDLLDKSLDELLAMTVVTATKVAVKNTDSPVTVRIITREQIERMGFRDLKDIFRMLPGFDVSYDVQGEVKSLVIAHGVLGNQKLTILQDGKRYSPATGERFVYGHNVPLAHLKRIEVVYGPASALYGADAFSGVINMISMDGADLNGAHANLGYVDTGATVADVTFGKVLPSGLDVVFGLRFYHGEDYELHEEYPEYDVVNAYSGSLAGLSQAYPIDNWNAFLKVKKGNWTLSGDWQHQLESNAPSTIPTNYAYVEDYVWGQDLGHVNLTHRKELNDNAELQTSASLGRYEVNPASNFFIMQNAELTEAAPSYKYALSENIKVESQLTWTRDKTTLVGGVFYEDVRSFPKTQNLDAPFDTSGPLEDDLSRFVDENGFTFGLQGLTEDFFGERNYTNYGAYLQGQRSMGTKIDLTLGARYDENSLYGSTVNPRLGLVYRATEAWTLRGSYGSAYIQPSNYYRWENWANPFAMHIPNEDIQPETVDNLSVGSVLVKNNLSLQVELFYNDLQDVIRPVGAPAQEGDYPFFNPLRTIVGGTPDSGFVEINANQGEIQTYGADLEVRYKYNALLSSFAYSYLDGDDDGLPIPKTSEHKILVNAEYGAEKWEIGATLRYFSSINTSLFNSEFGLGAGETYSFDGATVLYANLSWLPTRNLRLNLAMDNLSDERFYGAAPYGESIWITSRAPQAGRKIWLNLSYRM